METISVPFYDLITNEDIKVLSDLLDDCCKSHAPETSCSIALNQAIKDFPDDPRETFLEFYGCYILFIKHDQAEELFASILSQSLENMNLIYNYGIPVEPDIWQIHLAHWRLKIGK
jgi:hypothetical protein